MEKLITELKRIVDFKDTTSIGDIVLVVAKEPQMLIYAYVTNIQIDSSRKDEWWTLDLTMLSIPQQNVSWTLRTPQMTGMEIFTMGGEERFIKAVELEGKKKSEPLKNLNAKIKKTALKRVK